VFASVAQPMPRNTRESGPPIGPPSATPRGPLSALPPLSLITRISVSSSTPRSRSPAAIRPTLASMHSIIAA